MKRKIIPSDKFLLCKAMFRLGMTESPGVVGLIGLSIHSRRCTDFKKSVSQSHTKSCAFCFSDNSEPPCPRRVAMSAAYTWATYRRISAARIFRTCSISSERWDKGCVKMDAGDKDVSTRIIKLYLRGNYLADTFL